MDSLKIERSAEAEIEQQDSEAQIRWNRARYPWKYLGYKAFTSFASSDDDFFAVRRFGRIHIRALFTLQDQVSDLESQLNAMDNLYSREDVQAFDRAPPRIIQSDHATEEEYPLLRPINNGTIRDDMPQRADLVSKIIEKLSQYDDLLLKYSALKREQTASKRHIQNIKTWISDHPCAIDEAETDFINHTDDLVGVSVERSVARQLVETQMICKIKALFKIVHKRPDHHMTAMDSENLQIYDDNIVNMWASSITFLMAAFMLVVPLWILQSVKGLSQKLAIITIFMLLCLSFLTFATVGRPFERIAGTAGYAAVLVVFLQVGDIH